MQRKGCETREQTQKLRKPTRYYFVIFETHAQNTVQLSCSNSLGGDSDIMSPPNCSSPKSWHKLFQ